MSHSKRDHIIQSARTLFQREGFHCTGIDRLLEHAGVAKMTLYNNFGSKEQLIVDVLEDSSKLMVDRFQSFAQSAGSDPYDQILGIFRSLGAWYDEPEFSGCIFQAAAAEFPEEDSGPARATRAHHERVHSMFLELCSRAELRDPQTLARKLALLSSGATCVARQKKDRTPADDALQIAEILLERASVPV